MPIKIKLALILLLASTSLPAQTVVTISPGNPTTGKLTVPIHWWQTFAAHVDGQNDKSVTWSVSGSAALHGDTTCSLTKGISSDCEIAVTDNTQETVVVTATTNTGGTTGTGAVIFGPIPTPLTTHPREWFTSSDLTRLRTYLASGGVIPASFINLANTIAANDDVAWNPSSGGGGWTGVVGSWPGGGTGLPNNTVLQCSLVGQCAFPELGAMVYAIMANFDPVSANRPQWAVRAHDSYIMNMKEMLGILPTENPYTCFCLGNGHYLLGNRGSVWGVGVGLVFDWVHSTFTTADLQLIQPALMQMQGQANTNEGIIATSTPLPLGVYNDPSLFQVTTSADAYGYMRSFANNYGLFYSASEIAMAKATDASDDPFPNAVSTITLGTPGTGWAVNDQFSIQYNNVGAAVGEVTAETGGVPTAVSLISIGVGHNVATGVTTYPLGSSTGTGLTVNITALQAHCAGGFNVVCTDGYPNSIRAGFDYSIGSWIYLQNANFEDPSVVAAEYNSAYGSSLTANDQCPAVAQGNPSPATPTMPCYGNERGGLSHEGTLYITWLQHYTNVAMLLQSSGNMDATAHPQISFFTSVSWDQMVSGLEHITVPALYTTGGQTYQNLFAYGPNNQIYDSLDFTAAIPMGMYAFDLRNGRNDNRIDSEGWLSGNLTTQYTIPTIINGNIPGALNLLMTELPGATPFSTFTDPRPTMSPWYFSYNAGNLITSTGNWSATTGAAYRRYCPRYPQPNHEEGYCPTFDFWFNGDWVTKGIYSYAFNDNSQYWTGESADTANMMGLGNNAPTSLPNPNPNEYIVNNLANRGSRYNNGYPIGETNNDQYADSATYTSDHIDQTNQANWYGPVPGVGSGAGLSVTSATTEYVWIKPHFLFAYDRANLSSPSFRRRWFMSTGTPTISGTTISWPSALNKSSNYLHVLLQPNTNLAAYPVYKYGEYASGDYTVGSGGTGGQRLLIDADPIQSASESFTSNNCNIQFVCPAHQVGWLTDISVTGGSGCGTLTVQDNANAALPPNSCQYFSFVDGSYAFTPADLAAGVTINYTYDTFGSTFRTLNVTEAQNFGTGASTVTLVQSISGQNFDGGLVGTNLVMFMRNLATFTGTTYAASGATTHYIVGLTPNTVYSLTGAGTPANVKTDNSGAAVFSATGTGNITVGATTPPVTFTIFGGTWNGITTH